ncbi:hypothetical protein LSTR_LSTR013805 [Laodelphax striatellus]|uniref:Uncharacterized protein n=1 Tax=Laodelphax striatellus TaxID=195883 RepID=A0A482XTC7_LAOST|nr:hypothetical protein LSTR_LSTR013805 [Laodelphax striatellus]
MVRYSNQANVFLLGMECGNSMIEMMLQGVTQTDPTKCLRDGIFPEVLKVSRVVPVYKKGPKDSPDPPYNCTLMNQTSDSLEVGCAEGFNGGQRQQFQLEVYQLQTNLLLENKTSSLPSFVVGNLAPGQLLKMIIYATNSKGRSDQILMEGFTLKVAEKQTGSPVQFELTPFIGVVVMASTLVCVAGAIIFASLKARSRSRCVISRPQELPIKDKATLPLAGAIIFASLKARSRSRCVISRPQELPIKDKATLPLRSHVQDLYDMDDKNPDLIPCNKVDPIN